MKVMEWVIVIGSILAPMIALMIILPKRKKAKKVKEKPKYYESQPVEPKVEEQPIPVQQVTPEVSETKDLESYRDYVKKRQEKTLKPIKLEMDENHVDLSKPYVRGSQNKNNSDTLSDLSPEVKAILFTNLFDTKF